MRVLWKLFSLFRNFKPLTFFGSLGILVFLLGVLAAIPPAYGYIRSGYRETTHAFLAILAPSLILLSSGLMFFGLLLHAINWRLKELHNVMIRRHL